MRTEGHRAKLLTLEESWKRENVPRRSFSSGKPMIAVVLQTCLCRSEDGHGTLSELSAFGIAEPCHPRAEHSLPAVGVKTNI